MCSSEDVTIDYVQFLCMAELSAQFTGMGLAEGHKVPHSLRVIDFKHEQRGEGGV